MSPTFEEIVYQEQYRLRAYVGSFGVRSSEVDDIAQKAFLLLHEKWDTLTPDSNHGAYLRKLAKGLIMNEISKTSNRKALIDKNMTTLLMEHDSKSPIDELISGEQFNLNRQKLSECVKQLQENSARILTSRYWDGLNSTQIAEKEGKSSGAIRKLLMKIMGTLRACMTST